MCSGRCEGRWWIGTQLSASASPGPSTIVGVQSRRSKKRNLCIPKKGPHSSLGGSEENVNEKKAATCATAAAWMGGEMSAVRVPREMVRTARAPHDATRTAVHGPRTAARRRLIAWSQPGGRRVKQTDWLWACHLFCALHCGYNYYTKCMTLE